MIKDKIVIALPKGRILNEAMPLIRGVGIEPEPSFDDLKSRQLRFSTNHANIDIIRVRSFDVATFVAFGAAQIGICGNDVLMEFEYSDIYSPVDLQIGKCHISVAAPKDDTAESEEISKLSSIMVATKYPNITKKYFEDRGVQANCVKLNGAMELAPALGLCKRIVDLVSTGATLKANGLVEIERIADISSRLIVNRPSYKTRPKEITDLIHKFGGQVNG